MPTKSADEYHRLPGGSLAVVRLVAGCLGLLVLGIQAAAAGPAAAPLEWADAPGLLARIHAPEFPARDFPVTAYGAKGDGQTDSLPAVRAAIAACHAAGGGHVIVPAGTFLLNFTRIPSPFIVMGCLLLGYII